MHSEYQDDYQRVTNQIIEAMEKGAGDWKMPWHQTAGETFVPINAQSKKPYRGINILSLWAAAEECGRQHQSVGNVQTMAGAGSQRQKKQRKQRLVVFWKLSYLGIKRRVEKGGTGRREQAFRSGTRLFDLQRGPGGRIHPA